MVHREVTLPKIFTLNLTLKERVYFTNEKDGGGHYAPPPPFISACSNGKRLVFQGTNSSMFSHVIWSYFEVFAIFRLRFRKGQEFLR